MIWYKVDCGYFPEMNEEVLCYTKDGKYTIGMRIMDYVWDLQNDSLYTKCDDDIIAWTGLPKYESGEEEK